MEKNQTKKISIIYRYFTKDIYIEIYRITMISDIDNNEKADMIKSLLRSHNVPFNGLGQGTNRMAIQLEGYAVKIALDKDGMIDNRREMLYSKPLQPYVVKVYECIPNGMIAVTEYVEIFNMDDFHRHRETMTSILEEISEEFLIGDVGITGKNYVNWGTRNDGSICILDFAYIYSVQYKLFTCNCADESLLKYDQYFVNLICPSCGRKYTFGEIRRKITRKQQEEEIGDIRRLSYNIHKEEEIFDINPEFEPKEEKKEKKKLSETEQQIKDYLNSKKHNKENGDDYYWGELEENEEY